MISKNLKYYRLRSNMSKKELASRVGLTSMAITNYENGNRKPGLQVLRSLAQVLNVHVSDFLKSQNENLDFSHGEFRKATSLSGKRQDYIRSFVEDYLNRFFTIVEILGGEPLPEAPDGHCLPLSEDSEKNAASLRSYLGLPEKGPAANLILLLENLGILVFFTDEMEDSFSGMNGTVNGRLYIVLNPSMSPERIRSTLAHELAHYAFQWPETMSDSDMEAMATAISGAFLFPADDAKRELGIKRHAITRDMQITAREYGISMYLLAKRAALCGIVSKQAETSFYISAGKKGWRKNEPVRIEKEEPSLFEQLVYRAVSEHEVSIQKGAELLGSSYENVASQCFSPEE